MRRRHADDEHFSATEELLFVVLTALSLIGGVLTVAFAYRTLAELFG